ncbi:uncharacterized protein PG998_013462 [Apiospora kogelbergensis]|uniref:uncharacterized protein n=1 Tax=Apiospora kogelbergensis TaxID=1337665 RepID=UPI00312CD73B
MPNPLLRPQTTMETFLGQRAPSSPEYGDEVAFQLLSDSQISDLDLSSTTEPQESTDAYGFVRSPLAPVQTSQGRSHRPSSPQIQRTPSEYSKNFQSQPRKPFSMPSPYGNSSNEKHRHDAVPIDARRLPLHPDESQQDLAERINALTQAIQSNTQFCVDLSTQMLTLASQNKHLVPAFSSKVSSVVANYVIVPALRLPGALKTFYPALQEYEDKVRRTLANCANGRDMALAQGVGTESDVKRLKDRLVEQDALLRVSSSHTQRLMRERDALRQQLSLPLTKSDASETDNGTAPSEQKRHEEQDGSERTSNRQGSRDSVVLADQLREIRILVDQLALDTASTHDRNGNSNNKEDGHNAVDTQGEEEEDDWMLL